LLIGCSSGGERLATDDEIRGLCLLVLRSRGDHDFEDAICNLRVALTERFLDIENLGIHLLLNMSKERSPALDKISDKDEPNAA
jgi:hypothetical protein